MPKAIVDPVELRRFAQSLKRFNSALQDQMRSLQGQLAGLGDTWRDQEHDKFREEFDQTMQVLRRFMEAANEQAPLLLRKAEKIEEYLHQR
jgi:WXG100 family type VII secretion target